LRHDRLRPVASGEIGAEPKALALSVLHRLKQQRCAAVPMPGLDRIDAVPVRALATREQKINSSRSRATLDEPRVAKAFSVMPALGMRLQIEQADYVGGG
jgi:hypothetical protein